MNHCTLKLQATNKEFIRIVGFQFKFWWIYHLSICLLHTLVIKNLKQSNFSYVNKQKANKTKIMITFYPYSIANNLRTRNSWGQRIRSPKLGIVTNRGTKSASLQTSPKCMFMTKRIMWALALSKNEQYFYIDNK